MRIALIVLVIIALFVIVANAEVRVKGYTRSDGTYVPGHYRSSPDNTPTNNYGFKGNTNPYTGQTGTNPYKGNPKSPYYDGSLK
jgi:hypothetical protein